MLKTTLAILAITLGGAATAATLDFAAEAANNGERGGTESLTLDGVDLTISGINGEAYLDGPSGGQPGGLGVCSTGLTNDAQCVVRSDDNVSTANGGEVAVIEFTDGTDYLVEEVDFRDDDHTTFDEGETVLISFDSGATFTEYAADADGKVYPNETVVAGETLQFKVGGSNPNNFYVGTVIATSVPDPGPPPSPVPLPAAAWLLLSGFGLLGGVKAAKRLHSA